MRGRHLGEVPSAELAAVDTTVIARELMTAYLKQMVRTIVGSLVAWGRAHGCTRGVLQVETTNVAARALYAGFGFEQHHEYRYLVAP